ncbi:SMP-30/gluconolactonase/LRE family protein [Halomonas sp. LR5S13]|uniref:SMP-30/gluconolactonase/LRE family protein n=1 Tax=Halomonas rhizosphaerae TaxID=3043296 RepID=UPI0024A982CE|nr:SMP-30/gluconolactonase/LRE family protein [Halomonas rhizosphaerae]MDI5921232.1 SMP-30/gluconolactonase/LRE family protein [Halomonas rhizosphaerae]
MNGATARVAVACGCELGEGPQWHAVSGRLTWCDILGRRLHWLDPTSGETGHRALDQMVSLAVPIAGGGMLLVGEDRLARFDPTTGVLERFCDFEAGNPLTRGNDGRVDRHGSLWLSSMGKGAELGAGRLYRLHRGTLVELRAGLTIPNAICFSPGGEVAWFTDTASGVVMRWPLDREGWPLGEPAPWADFSAQPGNPDGAVVDAEGHLWLALWGAGRVVRLDPQGREVDAITLPTSQPSCPAFGGERLDRLYITTAREGMDAARWREEPDAGHLFVADPGVPGLAEPTLRLA